MCAPACGGLRGGSSLRSRRCWVAAGGAWLDGTSRLAGEVDRCRDGRRLAASAPQLSPADRLSVCSVAAECISVAAWAPRRERRKHNNCGVVMHSETRTALRRFLRSCNLLPNLDRRVAFDRAVLRLGVSVAMTWGSIPRLRAADRRHGSPAAYRRPNVAASSWRGAAAPPASASAASAWRGQRIAHSLNPRRRGGP